MLIANPNSTSQSDALVRAVVAQLRKVPDLQLLVRLTHRARHAEELVRGLRREDFAAVVVLGGDGTVNEVVNGLLGTPGTQPPAEELPVLGVIPTGSANVFARALGFDHDPVLAAQTLAGTMAYDLRRSIRLGTFNQRWFAVNAGFGLDADILAAVDRARQQGRAATPVRYFWASLRGWHRARRNPPQINVFADNGARTFSLEAIPLLFASNTNPWSFLGPLPMVTNPRNSFDHGLGLFGVSDLQGPAGLAGLMYLFGAHHFTRTRVVQFDDAQLVELSVPGHHRFQADGESQGRLHHVVLRSIPQAIEVFAP